MADLKISKEISLKDFEFWSGAKTTRSLLTDKELDLIEETLEDIEPNGMDATSLNDFFWFDTDIIAEWLGYENYEQMFEDRAK